MAKTQEGEDVMTAKKKPSEAEDLGESKTEEESTEGPSKAESSKSIAPQGKNISQIIQPKLEPSTVFFPKSEGMSVGYSEGDKKCFGLIETRGFLPLVVAADAMLKAANIHLVRYERVLGELVAICAVGDISAVRIAVESGIASAQDYGEVVASAVLSNPAPAVAQTLYEGRVSVEDQGLESSRQSAIGILETRGFVCAMVALDSMLKAANVRFCGFENTTAGTVAPIITGDLSAVRYAVDAGVEAANRTGEVIASQVLARPQVTQESVLPLSDASLGRLIPRATGN
jgi:carbon dioxide concentrating mechanism protein CcmO